MDRALVHVPTNSEIFETAYLFMRIRVDGALNHSGERFKNNAVSMSELTGFVWTDGLFV